MSIAVQFINNKYGDKLIAGKPLKSYSTVNYSNIAANLDHKTNDLVIFIRSNLVGLTEEIINRLLTLKKNDKTLLGIIGKQVTIVIIDKKNSAEIKLDLADFENIDNSIVHNLENDDLKLINSISGLINFEQDIQKILRSKAIENGVFIQDPNSTFLSYDTEFASNVTIEPNVYFGPKVNIGNNVHIRAFSYIEDVIVEPEVVIGPYARIRGRSEIGKGAKIGNFVEIKNSKIASKVKASHLSYIGDADIGIGVNIGAGTITCNYDGKNKHKTIIGEHSFIGANNLLIAPVTIGKNSIIGAGCMIKQDISDKMFVKREVQQKIKANKKEL